ncbi:hypothetical protein [Burkholderia multivorans]|uniref:hypothetical protein n=1 Tax=Burkholderia multivorans TaxID=87883 RepID=UPI000D0012A6|nr:hypothetical protein [Burkholderia multivorans]PRE16206.1 hypothetical protein C6P78_14175 [Burkholderia multivorans]
MERDTSAAGSSAAAHFDESGSVVATTDVIVVEAGSPVYGPLDELYATSAIRFRYTAQQLIGSSAALRSRRPPDARHHTGNNRDQPV